MLHTHTTPCPRPVASLTATPRRGAALAGLLILSLVACKKDEAPPVPVAAPVAAPAAAPAAQAVTCQAVLEGAAPPSDQALVRALYGSWEEGTRGARWSTAERSPGGAYEPGSYFSRYHTRVEFDAQGVPALLALMTVWDSEEDSATLQPWRTGAIYLERRDGGWCVRSQSRILDFWIALDRQEPVTVLPVGAGQFAVNVPTLSETTQLEYGTQLLAFLPAKNTLVSLLETDRKGGSTHCGGFRREVASDPGTLSDGYYALSVTDYDVLPGETRPRSTARWIFKEGAYTPEQPSGDGTVAPQRDHTWDDKGQAAFEVLPFQPPYEAPSPDIMPVTGGARFRLNGVSSTVLLEREQTALPPEEPGEPAGTHAKVKLRIALFTPGLDPATGTTITNIWEYSAGNDKVMVEYWSVDFQEGTLRVTDLDGDGTPEVSIVHSEWGPDGPPEKTLVLFEGTQRWVLTGQTLLVGDGSYTATPALDTAPEVFRAYLDRRWRAVCEG